MDLTPILGFLLCVVALMFLCVLAFITYTFTRIRRIQKDVRSRINSRYPATYPTRKP